MSTKILTNLDLVQNQLLKARIENQSSDPGSGVSGQIYYNTTGNVLKYYDGTTWQTLSFAAGAVASVSSTAPIKVNGTTSAQTGAVTVSIDPASGSTAGSMSSAHYTLVNNATSSNTNSTLVLRDSSGNFATSMITISGTPTNSTDVATKGYVDGVATGLDVKASVRVASTANVSGTYTATGGTSGRGQFTAMTNTIDGVTLANGNRVLLKDQSTGAQNGIWVVTTVGTGSNGTWDRATDFDADAEVTAGAFTFVEEGTTNQDSGWVLTTNNPITIGGASGTSLAFAQFSGAGQITAGSGLQKSGNTLSILVDPASGSGSNILTTSASGLKITTTNITGVGTLTAGTWQATTIAPGFGGTGLTSYTSGNLLYANGTTSLTVLAPNATATKQFLSMTSSVPAWGVLANTDIPAFTGANGTVGGSLGGVPAPAATDNVKFLRGDATWVSLSSVGITSVSIGSTNGGNTLLSASTTSGATTIDFVTTVPQNKVLAGPTGSTGAPTFRFLVTGDFGTNVIAVANGGTGLSTATTNGVLIGASSSTTTFTAAGSADNVFRVPSAGGAPAFGTLDLSKSGTVGTSILGLANGGTNAASASAARTQLASDISGGVLPVKVAFNVGDAASTAITVTHNLGTRDLTWNLASSSTPWDSCIADITFPTTNTATVTFSVAPALNAYRLTLIG